MNLDGQVYAMAKLDEFRQQFPGRTRGVHAADYGRHRALIVFPLEELQAVADRLSAAGVETQGIAVSMGPLAAITVASVNDGLLRRLVNGTV